MLKLIHACTADFWSVKDYYDSFEDKWRDMNCYAITCIVNNGPQSYFDYIHTYEQNLYYLINDENPNYIIGFGTITDSKIRDCHKENLNIGNIGYGIRPTERKNGYGSILLNLLLLKCEEFGMSEVCVSCLKENIASSNVIRNNNGKLEKEFWDEDTGKYGLKYWIKLHPKISVRIKRLIKTINQKYGL